MLRGTWVKDLDQNEKNIIKIAKEKILRTSECHSYINAIRNTNMKRER